LVSWVGVQGVYMTRNIRIVGSVVCLGLAACSRQGSMDEQMKQDLEAASVSTMELTPGGGGQRVVSAIEQVRPGQPAPTKRAPAAGPAKAPQTPQTPRETATGPAATRPTQRPAVNPPPPGGYKTINEVLKNAPFPIKP
jgi:hypothetical protein